MAELISSDCDAQQDALRLLGRTFYADPAIIEVIQHLQMADDVLVRAAAQSLCGLYEAS